MKRGFTPVLPSIFLLACTPSPGLDDELGTTTTDESSDSTTDSEDSSTTDAGDTAAETDSGSDGPTPDLSPVECDFWAQDCAPGEKCVAYSSTGAATWDSYRCVAVMGDQQAGEPCWWGGIVEATDDCDANSYCFDTTEVDGELVGTCYAHCLGTPEEPECPPESECSISGDGVLNLCIPTCDPLAQDCADGLGCYWTNSSFNCVVATEDIPVGEPCSFVNDCTAGNQCLDGAMLLGCEGMSCCTSYCDLALGDAECADIPETTCVGFFEEGEALPGYESVGVCVLPP